MPVTQPTPTRLRVYLYVIWALTVFLGFVGWQALAKADDALVKVGIDTAPSIIAAQEIATSLGNLDSNVGNYLLVHRMDQQLQAEKDVESERVAVTGKLVTAAKNITEGDRELSAVTSLIDGLGRYMELVGEIRYRRDKGDTAGATDRYFEASDFMHQRLLPAADALEQVNAESLTASYKAQQKSSDAVALVAAIVGAALVAFLIFVQAALFRMMRRILNPALVAATILCAGYGIYLVAHIATAREDLRVSKEDAFDSIHLLWKASAIAFDANGDETRFLLAPSKPKAEAFEKAYKTKIAKLTSDPRMNDKGWPVSKPPSSFKGLFADELRNVTFPGEGDAALAMVKAFAAYDKVDGDIRGLEKSDKGDKSDHIKAVALCVGTGAKESNGLFSAFTKALSKVIGINHDQFDRKIREGRESLGLARVFTVLASLAIAALAFVGIRARLREYEV